jgi:hypothetical protein
VTNKDVDNAIIRHINLSGDMYSLLVYGEESEQEKYQFQKHVYKRKNLPTKFLESVGRKETNYIEPRFRKLSKNQPYIYIVSLWGDVSVRKKIIQRLNKMKKKHNKFLIVGYWTDPGFDLRAYDGYKFDLLITSQKPHTKKQKDLNFLHVPVASLGLIGKKFTESYDCFSIGAYSELRLSKIINSEEQFQKEGVKSYYCIAGMQPNNEQQKQVDKIKEYREFPDRDFMHPDETLAMCTSTRVLLNISRLPESYETNPSYYAVMFNKKLLIDSDEIKKSPYYNPKYMRVVDFTKSNWLTPELAKWIKTPERINYNYKGEWEPEIFYRGVRELLKVN